MNFSNATIYRITVDPALHTVDMLDEALQKLAFIPCGPTQESSFGWVPPRGEEHGPMLESVAGQWLAKFMTETRSVPASAVKRRVDERCKQIEQATGRKPGKKEKKELKEDVLHEMLPLAFTKIGTISVWIDPAKGLMVLDTASASRGDDVVTALVKSVEGFAFTLLNTQTEPSAAMAMWLSEQEPPQGFTVDREVELRATDESKAVVRYAKHALDIDEVRGHIAAGKRPTRLALTWNDRVSLELTEGFALRKIKFLEGVDEKTGPTADDFDADIAIATGELSGLIADLVDALGGEMALVTAAGAGGGDVATNSVATAEAADNDDLYDTAVRVVREQQKASVSLIQRHLKIGYNRAARLLEAMEARQLVSPMAADGSREILKAA
ncbi:MULTISPECIES: recombination-associated protein RdgC [unclassified Variovorax]|uniref:recombination-associated protein RdgC n=1 Tax=unclassified Variovorax TaxID=663243 RepID=UPI00076D3B2D|nr:MULTISPECIES: recombination-associated protein RdgC [unclassified Variovorax]KWT65065.1 DNA recombination-dependent growth factor C [Variovorax sp. WDL1]PNG49063.1 Recombination-associated protein RdgC [Variovorax sp. B2]PNG49448.1 Recombination-associated protein RdgC [Variovorax sp. B4]VTV18932.1 Recombination-associated protein RdgC [Variovorax sp. WDL1]